MDNTAIPPPEPPTAQPPSTFDKTRGKRKRIVLVLIVLFVVAAVPLAVWVYNQTALQKPLENVLTSDPRNKVVFAKAHFDGWVNTGTIVFNLTDVAGNSSQADVFRVLLQYARALKDQKYDRVILAAYGEKKFVIPGEYFQQLGLEYETQNPMYTISTFPHHVARMNGEHPFPEYEGGVFAVLGKEMEEFNEMNREWYLYARMVRNK